MIRKKTVKKSRVPKTRNAGTMTEAEFWSRIRSSLRAASRYWKPILNAKNKARKPVKGMGNTKFLYQCNDCEDWFKGTEVCVDHIVPCGSLRSGDDVAGFIERLFIEDGYQVLCKPCHLIKTKAEKK